MALAVRAAAAVRAGESMLPSFIKFRRLKQALGLIDNNLDLLSMTDTQLIVDDALAGPASNVRTALLQLV